MLLEEKINVQNQAKLAGLSEAEFIRRRVLGYQVPPARPLADVELISELNAVSWQIKRVGQNVDQILLATYRGTDFVNHWQAVGREVREVAAQASGALEKVASLDGA